jgi:crossover junction endodeoxyribonuclease RusA
MIELSWPPKELNPNSTAKLRLKMRAKKAHRDEAYWATKAVLGPSYRAPEGKIPLLVTFYPPDCRKRDDDNMQGAFKRARDGIAKAMGIDDHRFSPRYQVGEPVKGGRVVVCIGEGA